MHKLKFIIGRRSLLGGSAVALLVVILFAAQDNGPNFSPWSPAVAVSPPIRIDWYWQGCPFISKSGLDLYFRKDIYYSGGGWSWDIYVSHRNSVDDPWQDPIHLGPNINTFKHELCSFVTIDGHWLYFVSNRTDLPSCGGFDIWVSHRKDKRDDTGWEPPKNLGPFVNSSAAEVGPCIFEDEATGQVVLYFNSLKSGKYKIYSCYMLDKQTVAGPATPVAELNSTSDRNDLHAFVRRKDGLEVIFASDRESATLGLYDLFVSTRPTTSDPWSLPVNLGLNINTSRSEARPSISWDGTTLYFWTDREWNPDGWWDMKLYQATRIKLPD